MQMILNEVMADDHGVTGEGVLFEISTQDFREGLESLLAFLIAEFGGPHPGDTERSLGPTGRSFSVNFGMNSNAGTGDFSERLVSELQGNAGDDGNETEVDASDIHGGDSTVICGKAQ